MKKIVFLLSILMVGCFSGTLRADGGTIDVHEEVIDGSARLVIEGNAHHAFRIVRGDADNRYHMSGHVNRDGYHVVYGYGAFDATPSFFDGFFIVLDESGSILMEQTIDFDHLEEVMDVYFEKDVAYVHLRQSVDHRPDGMIHRKDYLLEVSEGLTDSLHETSNEIKRIDFEHGMVYFSEAYQGHYEKGFDVHEKTLVKEEVYGLEPHGQYKESVEIHSFCEEALFEGEPFSKSLRVDYPGHYTLECDGRAYDFTVNPAIEGVEINGRSVAPVALKVSGGRIWLDDDLYINETLIETPGYHTLRIEGANDYLYTAHFTLKSGLEGVEEGGVYRNARTLFFNGEGLLNDETITSGHTLKQPGAYTLKILGESEYEEAVSFEILEGTTPKIKNIPIFELGIALVSILMTSGVLYFFLRKR